MLRRCGHGYYCVDCVKQHVIHSMRHGKTNMKCLEEGCDTSISDRELRAIVGDDIFAKIDLRALQSVVDEDPTLYRCPTPDCTFIVQWKGQKYGAPNCKCPLCKKSTCLVCGDTPYHTGKTCIEAKKEKEDVFEELKTDFQNKLQLGPIKSLIKSQRQRSQIIKDKLDDLFNGHEEDFRLSKASRKLDLLKLFDKNDRQSTNDNSDSMEEAKESEEIFEKPVAKIELVDHDKLL